jgi:hypothetical protein
MKQTTRLPVRERTCLRATHRQAQTGLHDFFHPVIDWTIASCEATPIASQDLLIAGWKKSMRVRFGVTTYQKLRREQMAGYDISLTGDQVKGLLTYIPQLEAPTWRKLLIRFAKRKKLLSPAK